MSRRRNTIKRNEKPINPDKVIHKLLEVSRFIRKRDLITQVAKKTGLSEVTITRKVDYLISNKEMVALEYWGLKKYGIQEKDERAVYLASKGTIDMTKHIESVFKLLDKNDINSIKVGVKELRNIEMQYYGKYFLDADQVNEIVKMLGKTLADKGFNDDTLRYDLLSIIFHEVTLNEIKPSGKIEFVELLEQLLKQYPSSVYDRYLDRNDNPIPYVIQLLGIYMNENVIERLKSDAETYNPQKLRNIEGFYSNWYCAKLIDDKKTNLMNFEVELQKKNNAKATEFIERLRKGATLSLKDIEGSWRYNLYEKVTK